MNNHVKEMIENPETTIDSLILAVQQEERDVICDELGINKSDSRDSLIKEIDELVSCNAEPVLAIVGVSIVSAVVVTSFVWGVFLK